MLDWHIIFLSRFKTESFSIEINPLRFLQKLFLILNITKKIREDLDLLFEGSWGLLPRKKVEEVVRPFL